MMFLKQRIVDAVRGWLVGFLGQEFNQQIADLAAEVDSLHRRINSLELDGDDDTRLEQQMEAISRELSELDSTVDCLDDRVRDLENADVDVEVDEDAIAEKAVTVLCERLTAAA